MDVDPSQTAPIPEEGEVPDESPQVQPMKRPASSNDVPTAPSAPPPGPQHSLFSRFPLKDWLSFDRAREVTPPPLVTRMELAARIHLPSSSSVRLHAPPAMKETTVASDEFVTGRVLDYDPYANEDDE